MGNEISKKKGKCSFLCKFIDGVEGYDNFKENCKINRCKGIKLNEK